VLALGLLRKDPALALGLLRKAGARRGKGGSQAAAAKDQSACADAGHAPCGALVRVLIVSVRVCDGTFISALFAE
jgi:hypothetical protein